MDWNLAQTYYLVASVAGIIATCINVVLYWRNRPNRLRMTVDAAVKEAVAPLLRDHDTLRRDLKEVEAAQQRCELGSKALDHELNGRLKEIDEKMDGQTGQLTKIGTTVDHMNAHDQSATLHHRVTDLGKIVSSVNASLAAQATQLNMIHTFLLQQGGKG